MERHGELAMILKSPVPVDLDQITLDPYAQPFCTFDTASRTYTSDRDPRIVVRVSIPTGTKFGRTVTHHCVWSETDARLLAERVSEARPMTSGYDYMSGIRDASATKLTTPEIEWLCTPTDQELPDWAVKPEGVA